MIIWRFLQGLAWQCVLLVPLFWFVELAQNHLYLLLTGQHGWFYPQSPHHWFSFLTLPSWAIAVTAMAAVQGWLASPRGWSVTRACLVGGTLCWALEWANGWFHAQVLGTPLYIWPASPLRYVGPEAVVWWWGNAWLHQALCRGILAR